MDGHCAMIHFGTDAKDIKVELLTVQRKEDILID